MRRGNNYQGSEGNLGCLPLPILLASAKHHGLPTNDKFSIACLVGPALLGPNPNWFARTPKPRSSNYFTKNRLLCHSTKSGYVKLSVFKGREAKLNRAIFLTLATKGPLTISGLQKKLSKQKDLEGTYYASLTKRIRCLKKAGYIIQISAKPSQKGSRAIMYDICIKAHLATVLNKTSFEELLSKVNDKDATILLSDLIHAIFY